MNIILNGAGGRMGAEIRQQIEKEYRGARLAAAVDLNPAIPGGYAHLNEYQGDADVIIDFSHHSAINDLLAYAEERHLPVVVATTGHDETERARIRAAGEVIPVLHCANTSIGIALLVELTKTAVAAFPEADIEIVETHHNRKADAPSGTALLLANAARTVREKAEFIFGRNGHAKRTPEEIGIHAVRRGNIVGTHEVLISTDTQTITLKHEAHDRALFAEGAIVAADFIVKQSAGYYTMQDIFAAKS